MRFARVHEASGDEKAIDLVASGVLPLEKMIPKAEPLETLPAVCQELHGNPDAVKVFIDCRS